MAGFNESYKHNSEFDKTLSNRMVRKRKLDDLAYSYIESLGLEPYCVKYILRGDKLSFNYNIGNRAYKRTVCLSTRQFIDVALRINRNYNVAYDVNTNTFYLKELIY